MNTIDGGPGDDTVHVGRAGQADDISGGTGVDTVTYAAHGAVTVTLDGAATTAPAPRPTHPPGRRARRRHAGGDTLVGSEGPDTLDGADGTDRLEGLGGADTLIGGLGVTTPPSAARATTRSCFATGPRRVRRTAAPARTPGRATSATSA